MSTHRPQSQSWMQRIQLQLMIRRRFAAHGDKACWEIMRAALEPQGLQRLLESVGLPPTLHFERQLDLLFGFLVEHGEDRLARSASQPAGCDGANNSTLFDAQGRYTGPERRSRIDRRNGAERRAYIDAVAKSYRYGGDRRMNPRRQADRERLGFEVPVFPRSGGSASGLQAMCV